MKMLVCSVYDLATKAFMQPFFVRTKGEAARSFMDACSDGKTNFCRHPSDFVLFTLGEFDDASGHIDSYQTPEKVMTALDCVPEGEVAKMVPSVAA